LVGDVVTDLPGFEYVNPHLVYPATSEDKEVEKVRARQYPQYNMAECRGMGLTAVVGEQRQNYLHPPLTEYQRRLRRGVNELTCHFSRTFNEENTERICNVSLEKGSDHRSLPENLRPWCLASPESRSAAHGGWPGLYGRLDPDGIFGTALTEIQPCGKSGTVLHPTQHRVISVREHARSQGFPDSYVFETTSGKVSEMHRAAGNAVPVPLSEALGRGLRDAVLKDFKRERDSKRESIP
jgi:DNA (cytosine-5)-methyltransferase 1